MSKQRITKTKASRDRLPPWTALNVLGLVLNVALFSATVVTYQRILSVTNTEPCGPGDSPEIRTVQTASSQSTKTVDDDNKNDNDNDNNNPLIIPHLAPPASYDPDKSFHIIFSTGCSPKQHWQSYVLFHSIMESGQNGHATRIASGCTPAEMELIQQMHSSQIAPMGKRHDTAKSRFHLHLTPEFGIVPGDKKEVKFHYLNKPYGVAHWMENVLGYSAEQPSQSDHDDTVIMLLDPDMIILRPMVNDFTLGPEIWRQRTTYPRKTKIMHGYPFSQEYGYSTTWFNGLKNVSTIFAASDLPTPAMNMTRQQIVENYTAGPPYMALARDFYKIAAKWREISVAVQRQFPDTILSEMYAYSWAAAHLELPHQQAHSFMVSAHFEEGFQLFRDNNLYPSNQMCRGNIPTSQKPHILHYCQRYAIGKYILGKHRLPKDFVGGDANITATCLSPLLAEPPTDVSTLYDFFIDPDGAKKRTNFTDTRQFTKQQHADRITFMLCEFISALNRAATYFKEQHCAAAGVKPNLEKALIFHDTLEID